MRINKRTSGLGLLALGAIVAACSVDTSDVNFVPDEVLAEGEGATGNVATGGSSAGSDGGKVSTAGANSTSGSGGKAGAATGGSPGMAGASVGGSAGTPTAGAPATGECRRGVGNPQEPEIDNLDDCDPGIAMRGGREGGWYVANDGLGTQTPMASVSMPPLPERPGALSTMCAMHTKGSGFTEWGAILGIVLLVGQNQPPCPYDVSPHRGVRFYAKGTISDDTLEVQFPTVQTHAPAQGGTCKGEGKCGDHFRVAVTSLAADWREYSVSFADARQDGWGNPVTFDPTQVLNVEFRTRPDTTFEFWIDQVSFF